MMFPVFSHEAWAAPLVNHLWQSTLVTGVAWLLTLVLRSNQARTRFWVWMIASIKFLIPFSFFIAAGEALRSAVATPIPRQAFATVIGQITQPFPQATSMVLIDPDGTAAATAGSHGSLLSLFLSLTPAFLLAVWACGVLILSYSWIRAWWRVRKSALDATPMTLLGEVPVLSSQSLIEPGVFGVLRPVVLLPASIPERLSAPQLATIVAHEMCHVRRRDNLTAALHMTVATLFWFHPAVWWIKARLLEERERACDEAVLESGNNADLYAESILNVCRFYVESPLPCVSGVTGSDLKRRIVRIMTERVTRRLDISRKLVLAVAAFVAVAGPLAFGLLHVNSAYAQAEADNLNIADTWQGTLHAGSDLRTVVKITRGDGGGYKAVFYSIDQGGAPMPVTSITLQGSTVKMSLTAIGGTYEGKLSADGKTIAGNWSQGPTPLPLTLTRATPETEWAIPAPPPVIPPMAADASPSFEVATVKPTKPDEQRKLLIVRGRRFETVNTSLGDLISFAYGVHAKQVIGVPAWADTDKFDITGQPDLEGRPNDKQLKGMLQKLLADRFKLSFHHDKRELSVYVLSAAKTGPKLTRSEGDPNGLPGLFFRSLGNLNVRNATMADFVSLMQSTVLDRPVVDQTALTGRFDFSLNWTPDDSQFGGMGAKIPPPTDSEKAPPGLYTAIQEQLGLKMGPAKAPDDVIVIDHVEKPSEN